MADVNINFPPAAAPTRAVTAGEVEDMVIQAKADVEGQVSAVVGQVEGNALDIGDKTNFPTWLQDSLREVSKKHDEYLRQIAVNVKQPPYNAKGDGTTDDTTAIQSALDGLSPGQTLYFPNGTYLVSNLTIPNKSNMTLLGDSDSVIKKSSSGLSTHLAASYNYLNNINTVGVPLKIRYLKFDGNNLCDDVLILQVWNSSSAQITVRNGLRYGLTYTADTQNGTSITSTAVNNRLDNSWIHNNAVQNIRIADTSRTKVSDMFITNNFIYTAQVGIYLQTSAGTLLSGNHLYGHSSYDVQVSISSFAFQIVNNYFEGSTGTPKVVLYIQDFIANTACIFASNTVAGEVRLYSGNVGSQFLSTGNNYRTVDGCIKNNWNVNVTAISTGDRFESQRPFLAVDNNWALNASSNSRFIVNGSTTNYFSDIRKIDGVINASNTILATVYGTTAPTAGTFSAGSICRNTSPTNGGISHWECVAGGTPGTWVPKQIGVMSVITAAPSFVGQFAVVGGIGYMATGIATTADWKQITN